MLTLTRKVGQAFLIDDGAIVLRVHKVTPTRCELEIEADGLRILRGEVLARIGRLPAPPHDAAGSRQAS